MNEDPANGHIESPYAYGAIGDGKHNDSQAFRKTYESVLKKGGGSIVLDRGRFFIPQHFEMEMPGVSLVGGGTAIVGGGEVRIGPQSYDADQNGVDFSGNRVAGICFNNRDDFGSSRSIVLRNVRGLDICQNYFTAAGKGITAEAADGNKKFHTTAMVRVANNRFSNLTYGIYCDTDEWDRLSDWQVSGNYFNYCSDTAVWIGGNSSDTLGGIDGLEFSGNTIFSIGFTQVTDPLFAKKRYNLRLGKSNWVRIMNNNFFEAGLSAVLLEDLQNFLFVGNHVAWPGQRELADGVEIHHGKPVGVVEGNTFSRWTRAAVGFYDVEDLGQVEIGQNAWSWSPSPNSWTGALSLPGYRVFASETSGGSPIIRDFKATGTFDQIVKRTHVQSRDPKTATGGISGASRRRLSVEMTAMVFRISNIVREDNFGGLLLITATNSGQASLLATYLLFVASVGNKCSVVESGGHTDGSDSSYPSFTWTLSNGTLLATPVGIVRGDFDFDAVGFGAVLAS